MKHSDITDLMKNMASLYGRADIIPKEPTIVFVELPPDFTKKGSALTKFNQITGRRCK